MIRNWSLDREETARCEKPFQDTPKIEPSSWILAYNFLFKEKGEVQYCKQKNIFIVAKKENTHYITQHFIAGRYELMTIAFDDFIDYNMGVRIIKLDKENWVNSKCSCGWYLKNYNCYHLIVVAVNQKLVQIPIDYKDVPNQKSKKRKSKRGRKAKAKLALLKNHD